MDTQKKPYWSIASWTLAALNTYINKLFRESNPTHMLIVDGVQFENIEGNVYLFWASTVNKQNVNGIDVDLFIHTPVLIVCDGYGAYKYLYLFCDKKVHHIKPCTCKNKRCGQHNFRLDFSFMESEFFCMESPKRTDFILD